MNFALVSALVVLAGSSAAPVTASSPAIGAPPKALKLPAFYRKHVDAQGIPIVSSAKVPARALHAARAIVEGMLSTRPDIRDQLIRARVRVAVMGELEVTTDIPEHSQLGAYWNARARGLGATAERPVCSCAEENLLQYRNDRYLGESILVHEFAHTIFNLGLPAADSTFAARFSQVYSEALHRGLFRNTYAASNAGEYWAEGVQSWFDANLEASPADGIHNEINTRAELERYDPGLAKLIAEAFRDNPWRWQRGRRSGSIGR